MHSCTLHSRPGVSPAHTGLPPGSVCMYRWTQQIGRGLGLCLRRMIGKCDPRALYLNFSWGNTVSLHPPVANLLGRMQCLATTSRHNDDVCAPCISLGVLPCHQQYLTSCIQLDCSCIRLDCSCIQPDCSYIWSDHCVQARAISRGCCPSTA